MSEHYDRVKLLEVALMLAIEDNAEYDTTSEATRDWLFAGYVKQAKIFLGWDK